MTDTLVGRLRADAVQLRKMIKAASFAGDGTSVRVLDPSGLLADLDEAAAEIERLTRDVHLMGLERDRIARNRDMWKDQCERQSAQLTELHATESSLSEAVKAAYEDAAKIAERDCRSGLAKDYGYEPTWFKHGKIIASAIRSRAAVLEQK